MDTTRLASAVGVVMLAPDPGVSPEAEGLRKVVDLARSANTSISLGHRDAALANAIEDSRADGESERTITA